jgi:hypothetical protein
MVLVGIVLDVDIGVDGREKMENGKRVAPTPTLTLSV